MKRDRRGRARDMLEALDLDVDVNEDAYISI